MPAARPIPICQDIQLLGWVWQAVITKLKAQQSEPLFLQLHLRGFALPCKSWASKGSCASSLSDQGLCLIPGRGPEARGNFSVCPQAEMWDSAQGSLDRGQQELLSTAGQQVGPALAWPLAADRAPVQGLSSLSRGAPGDQPLRNLRKKFKMSMENPGKTDRKWPWPRLLSEHQDFFSFLLIFLEKWEIAFF